MPEKVYLNHGDPRASEVLTSLIEKQFGVDVDIPEMGETFEHK